VEDREEFRREVRQWIQANCPADLRRGSERSSSWESYNQWLRALGSRGWAAPAWPTEYGGAGLDREGARVLRSELRAAGAPLPDGFGLGMLGPTLLEFGTEEQKREHLPPIARHEILWCQGYSEPGAGSDLANIQTRAIRDGDEYVITGQKIWTTSAQEADWMFCLVRTDPEAPKHEGISFILFPMDQPGVAVAPLRLITGDETFAQVFFDGARARACDVIGPVNGGWTVAKRLLQHERGGMASRGEGDGSEEDLLTLARREVGMRNEHLADPVLRERVAQQELDTLCFGLTMRRAAEETRSGQVTRSVASIGKYYASELYKRERELAVAVMGARGLGWSGTGFTDEEVAMTRSWLGSKAGSIYGGTSEIQLNIIAKRVLEIPE
jgi:alkylation response protein AidB-like acyl-CoA dehydrogenase